MTEQTEEKRVAEPSSRPPRSSYGSQFYGPGVIEDRQGYNNRALIKDPRLRGRDKWKTIALLSQISTIAASVRWFLSLIGDSEWHVQPAEGEGINESTAQEVAEFIEKALYQDCCTSFHNVQRNMAKSRLLGFSIEEFWLKPDPDNLGRLTIDDIQDREASSILKFNLDENGDIVSAEQQSDSRKVNQPIPREQMIYTVNNVYSNSVFGHGLLFDVAPTALDLFDLVKNRQIGYAGNFANIPILLLPYGLFDELERDPSLNDEQRANIKDNMMMVFNRIKEGFKKFDRKENIKGFDLDSSPWAGTSGGDNPRPVWSSIPQYDIKLLSADNTGFAELHEDINSLHMEIARVLGTESLLLGADTGSANRALAEQKNHQFFKIVNSQLAEHRASLQRDLIIPLCLWNGFPKEYIPTLEFEDIQEPSTEHRLEFIRLLSTGAHDFRDPIYDETRISLGFSPIPQEIIDEPMERPIDIPTGTEIEDTA